MKQSQMSPTFDCAAETEQCHAVPAGFERAAFHPEIQRHPAAWQLPGSRAPGAADLQAAPKHTHFCIH